MSTTNGFTLRKIAKPLLLGAMAVMLFLIGIVVSLYGGWSQDALREAFVRRLNAQPGMQFRLDRVRLWFPLRLEVNGLSMVQSGDTLVSLGALDANVRLMPLFAGQVELENADVSGALYKIGNRDSATALTLRIGNARLAPARVRLADMNIRLDKGALADASVDLFINPNPPEKAPADTSASAPMKIEVGELAIDRLRYRMNLLPVIDSLGVTLTQARLKDASIDLEKQKVNVSSLTGSGLYAAYILPDSATIANTVVAPPDSSTSAPWTVKVSEFDFDDSKALYTTRGYRAAPGLDFGYISVTDVRLAVHDFYNCASVVRVPLRLDGTERCGVQLDVSGTLGVDEPGITFSDFSIATAAKTALTADGFLGTGDLVSDPEVPVRLKAEGAVATADLRAMFPVFESYLAPLDNTAPIGVAVDVNGNMGKLDINGLAFDVKNVADIHAHGSLSNVMSVSGLDGDIEFAGTLGNVNPWAKMFMAVEGLTIPDMSMQGHIVFDKGDYSGNLEARTGKGELALDGSLRGRGNVYSVSLDATRFPLAAFMPKMGVGDLTGSIELNGKGFDILSPSAALDAVIDIESVAYAGKTYTDLSGNASLKDGKGHLDLTSANAGLDFSLLADAEILPDNQYHIIASLDGKKIDMQALGLAEGEASLSAYADVDATFDKSFNDVAAVMTLDRLNYVTETDVLNVDDVMLRVNATDTLTNAFIRNRDLYAFFSSPMGLDSLAVRFGGVSEVLDAQMAEHRISVIEVQQQFPAFRLDVDAGDDNMLTQILKDADASFAHLTLQASNDSVLNLSAKALEISSGTKKMDTVTFDIAQHGRRLDYVGMVNNRPGTFDAWAHIRLDGFFENDELGLELTQHDIAGKMGFDVGARVRFYGDSTAVLRLDPLTPTIAYKEWTVNDDNFISYSFKYKHLDANLRMHGAGSSVALYTEHATEHAMAAHGADEDLVLELKDVKIQDWIAINPFAPPMRGDLSANMRVNWIDRTLTGNGDVTLGNFTYGRQRVGDIRADVSVLTNPGGLINADLSLYVDNQKSLTLRGALNDSTAASPFNLDLTMIHFPLRTVNPFIPGVARLTGTLNGNLAVSGDQSAPILNGSLDFDSATVNVDMLGTKLQLSEVDIPVVDNVVKFNKFAVTACNDNPLTVDGTVSLRPLTSPSFNLHLGADNMLLVNTKRAPKGASVYGKAYIGLDADVTGSTALMNVKAVATVMSGTNVTYIIPDGTESLQSRGAGDMVKFVNFTDTAAVVKADSIMTPATMLLNVAATLNVQSGTTITVDLDNKGSNRVQLISQGSLNYTMNPLNSGRVTGRLNINGGFVRYSMPPVLSEKLFNFKEGSYVAFNGSMMNPLLNIHAVDNIRANVTQSGQNSRLIYFDVEVGVTGTLNNMDVAFDLATEDDATVANELASMSPSQRASAAMNLLVTNIYTGTDTKADSNLGGNALYSFLTSQLNSWAANTIKGVDLSFGINQYDKTAEGSTAQVTQYSYRVSKALFNDRFKIIVGGNYSTDDNANQNLANSLISDVSIEYMLNKAGTMYVRIFRHTGYESILEGEITQTGVGFVYKKKINRIKDMFRWRRRKRKQPVQDSILPEQQSFSPDKQSDAPVEAVKENSDEKH